MNLALDSATEQRIQREIDRGHFAAPDEVITRALDLLEDHEAWLQRNRAALNLKLDESFAAAERGDVVSADQARQVLAERRTARAK